jgi:hypothetical protein
MYVWIICSDFSPPDGEKHLGYVAQTLLLTSGYRKASKALPSSVSFSMLTIENY